MMTPIRYVVLVLGVVVIFFPFLSFLFKWLTPQQISLHYLLSFTHEGYGNATSIASIKDKFGKSGTPPYKVPLADDYHIPQNHTSPNGRRANATIVILGMWPSLTCQGPRLIFYQRVMVT